MLVKPTVAPLYRNKGKGIVQQNGRYGYVQRRLSYPVQTGSKLQVNWRQNFATAKYNFLSLGSNGANSAAVNGVAPATAWMNENESYNGILEAGQTLGNVQSTGILINCASEDAYYTKVQACRTAIGLPARPTPGTSINLLTPPSERNVYTFTGGTFKFSPLNTVQTNPQDILFTLGVDATTTTSHSAGASISATTTGLKVYQLSDQLSWYNPSTSEWEYAAALFLAEIDPGVAAGTYTVTAEVNLDNVVGFTTFDFTVTQPSTVPSIIVPNFAIPSQLYCYTMYDDSQDLAFFVLSPKWDQTNGYPMFHGTAQVPGVILITASDTYTSSYSPPDESEWKSTLYLRSGSGVSYITVAEYEAVHGTISKSGDIKFKVQAIDLCTGCPGPSISCTATWENGTFKGNALSSWPGNSWSVSEVVTGSPITAPGSATATFHLSPAVNTVNDKWPSGYTFPRTFTVSNKSSTIIPTGACTTKRKLPSDLTFTTNPSSITFNHETDASQAITVTITATNASAGCYSYDPGTSNGVTYSLRLKCDDGVYSIYGRYDVIIKNPNVSLPPYDYLTIAATTFSPTLSDGVTSQCTITLSNTGTDSINVSMLSELWGNSNVNQSILQDTPPTITFDNQSIDVPGGTNSSPGTATVVATVAMPSGVDVYGVEIHFEASAGDYTCSVYVG